MKSNNNFIQVMVLIIGILLFFSSIFVFFMHQTNEYVFLVIFASSIIIINSVFEFKKRYYKKNVYIAIVTADLLLMWVVSFIQTISPGTNIIRYYIGTGIITLMLLFVAIKFIQEMEKINS